MCVWTMRREKFKTEKEFNPEECLLLGYNAV
jgi:hypothetical protein